MGACAANDDLAPPGLDGSCHVVGPGSSPTTRVRRPGNSGRGRRSAISGIPEQSMVAHPPERHQPRQQPFLLTISITRGALRLRALPGLRVTAGPRRS
jgi:hypothetical protein